MKAELLLGFFMPGRTAGQLIQRWREPSLEAMLRIREEPPSSGHYFLSDCF